MPAGQPPPTSPLTGYLASTEPLQYKVCADCGLRIPCEQAVLFHDLPDFETCVVVCSDCRWIRLGIDHQPPRSLHATDSPPEFTHDPPPPSHPSSPEGDSPATTLSSLLELEHESISGPSRHPGIPCRIPLSPPPKHTTTTIPSSTPATTPPQSPSKSEPTLPCNPESRTEPSSFTDITRLRVNHTGKYCLYPGSTFRGVQKSGRSDYDVTVTILDVDFPTSSLCGYLEIRGLTEDWPELTTYFDAEIIGAQYSFLTRGWGATHEDDLHHWSQFPTFKTKEIQNDLQFPRYTLREELGPERGCVFMRWKERFLVPDHRVKDINGASFAGFYYICVEFEPPHRLDEDAQAGSPNEPIPASMSGFYFHKNSEPYQQLSLHHVPDDEMGMGNGTFEWR